MRNISSKESRPRFSQGKKVVKYLCIAAIIIIGLFSVIATDSGGGGGSSSTTGSSFGVKGENPYK